MLLYHGTAERFLPSILREGLRPRGLKKGNWKHSIESNSRAVYLTDAYVLHFAVNATRGKERCLILEINTNKLNPFRFAPDEDFLEQATRKDPNYAHLPKEMKPRTRWFRRRALTEFAHVWEKSLEFMGTCTYYGLIPPEAITRYVLIPQDHPVNFASDPTICLMNYAILKTYYRKLVKFAFGEDPQVQPDDPDHYMRRLATLPRDGLELNTVVHWEKSQ